MLVALVGLVVQPPLCPLAGRRQHADRLDVGYRHFQHKGVAAAAAGGQHLGLHGVGPDTLANQPPTLAGYTRTPLVKFPVTANKPGATLLGTTMAELGAGHLAIVFLIDQLDGQVYVLLANTRHGVMKIPTSSFATAQPITARVGGTAGTFERIASMTGVEQLDLLDGQRTIVIALGADGARNLTAIVVP